MSEWERQKKEINSYNLFLSGIVGAHRNPGLVDHGLGLIDPFLEIYDSQNDIQADPDFSLFNGDSLLLVEVKSGENVSQDHIDQMERYDQIGLEAAEDFLGDTGVDNPSSVQRVESAIVYGQEFIENCRSEWENCREKLSELESSIPVLTQKRGGKLQLDSDTGFSDSNIHSVLSSGIKLPKVPQRDIYLSENAEKESLAVSICHDIALNNLVGRFEIEPIEIRNFFGQRPNLDIERIRRTLEYLHEIGACTFNPDNETFVFTEHHEDAIISIEEKVRSERVEETLSDENEDQLGLEDVDYSRYESGEGE